MAELGSNQRSFIDMMKRTAEHERRGFALLSKHKTPETFFDTLSSAGFFAADRNPGPIPGDSADTVRIPFWAPLEYLVACAKRAGDDAELAGKLIGVLRKVTLATNDMRDNHHTARHFAEILGLLPSSSTTLADMDLARTWLAVRFNPGGVARELDKGAMQRFVSSEDPLEWEKAVRLFTHCTELRPVEKGVGGSPPTLGAVIEEYWLDEFVKHHAVPLSQKVPETVLALLEERLRAVFAEDGPHAWSSISRPAVEKHSQNHSWDCPENSFVDAARDVAIAWIDRDLAAARKHVGRLLQSEGEIIRRIGIHVIGERWDLIGDLYVAGLVPQLFQVGHIHEMYRLLERRFDQFTAAQQAMTLSAIDATAANRGTDQERRTKLLHLRWLSALQGSSSSEVKSRFSALLAQPGLGVPSHPDFNVYGETSFGPGPTPYQPGDLVALANENRLVVALNAFVPTSAWQGPTSEGLIESLEQAVVVAPESFLQALPSIPEAFPQYQHAIIRGFQRVWESLPNDRASTWDAAWPDLFAFFEALAVQRNAVEVGEGAEYRSQVLSGIAEFLRAGTRVDEHAYPSSFLARGWALVAKLLDQAKPAREPSLDDPMFQAINSTRGKVIEALFDHALRVCRLADREGGSRERAWVLMRGAFDGELAKCKGSNFEFSTLAGAYLRQLDYMDAAWTEASIGRMFPEEYPGNFRCAVGGLAYSGASKRLYVLLRDAKVVDVALKQISIGREARAKMVERVMLAYLWDEEGLESPRFRYLLNEGPLGDIQTAVLFLWSHRHELTSADLRAKVVVFWESCVQRAAQQVPVPGELLADLGRLAWSIDRIDAGTGHLLLASAPHLHRAFNVYEFLKELTRLAEASPRETGEVLRAVIASSGSFYDYQDRLRSLIVRLAELGEKAIAIECCNMVIALPGMDDVFRSLTGGSSSAVS
jgi:hypothetical protein